MTASRHHLAIVASLATLALPAGSRLAGQELDPPARLTLGAAVERALAYHPRVRAVQWAEQGAAAGLGVAAAERFPQLALQATLTRFEEPMIVAPLHGFDPTRPPEFSQTLAQGIVSLSYTLFDGGARGARVASARADLEAAGAGLAATEAELVADVARSYLGVLTARGIHEAQEQGITALAAERARVEQLLAEGTAAQVQLLRVQAALAEAEAARVSAVADLGLAERRLARLLGVDLGRARAPLLEEVRFAEVGPPERDAALASAARQNERLAEARWRFAGVQRDRRAAVAAWFPRLEVVGGYLGFGSRSGDLTTEWQAGVRLSYPIFAGGGRAHRVAAASARARSAEQQVRLVELETAEAADRAVSAVVEQRARVAAQESAVRHLSEVARIELLSLEAGAGTEADYLQAEAALRRARAALVAARHAEIVARIELAHVSGTLTPAWLTSVLDGAP